MWLVLCSPGDASVPWVHQGLANRGLLPLWPIGPAALFQGCRWEHRVASDGCASRLTLADGRVLESGQVRGTLNRLTGVPAELFDGSADRDYAVQELYALLLSWLHSLPAPVINRPVPQGISGAWRHSSQWVQLAARAGLPVPGYRRTSADPRSALYADSPLFPAGTPTRTVLVLGGYTAGAPAPPGIAEGCRRLARMAGTSLLGVDFADGGTGAWTFAAASPLPDLRIGGEGFLDLLAAALRSELDVAA
jgi:hypothetical protein